MKLKIFVIAAVIAAAGFIAYSQMKTQAFAPAEDFPRDAAVYVQIADLPALIKLWNESPLKEKYLASENFTDFANNHLGRKLASRWREFSDAAGFPIDLEVLSKLAGNQAAIALYDVGKLDFVFIAPVSDEIFAATKFARNRENFTEQTLGDGTIIYRVKVEADRGRQKQELIFTQSKGRFIAATSEKRLTQTLANISGGKTKNRLIDEPLFKDLSEKIEPHQATVWLNQTILNDDYYFKHYWLMSEIEALKSMRAGMFDFEIGTDRFVERRKFLFDKTAETSTIENSDIEKLTAFLPPDFSFYRLQSADQKTIDEAVEKTIGAARRKTENASRESYSSYSSFDVYNDYSSDDYESLNAKFDEAIDEADDTAAAAESAVKIDFAKILRPANPRTVLTFSTAKMLPAPLFVRFQNAAVFRLAAPESFDRENFEAAVARNFSAQTAIAAPDVTLTWTTRTENSHSQRELKLPMLEWSFSYALIGSDLIISDDANFLREIAIKPNSSPMKKQDSPLTSLTVINFAERENAYDKVFEKLNQKKQADDFFTNNIRSFLDSISQIKNIEIKEKRSQNTLDEELSFNF